MTSLLMLDDQPYTIEPLARVALDLGFEVLKEESILPFKETAERLAAEGRAFAVAIDMNLHNIIPLEIEELGATLDEIGNGEAAGLAVVRHVFMNAHREPLSMALSQVPIAIISAHDLKSDARREIDRLQFERAAETSFVPKPNSDAVPIPWKVSWEAFLKRILREPLGQPAYADLLAFHLLNHGTRPDGFSGSTWKALDNWRFC